MGGMYVGRGGAGGGKCCGMFCIMLPGEIVVGNGGAGGCGGMFVGIAGGGGCGGGMFIMPVNTSAAGCGTSMLPMSESDGIPWNSGGVPIGKEGPPTNGGPNGNGFGICI